MESIVSGSMNKPVGSMHFMESGELLIENFDRSDLSPEDLTSLMITQEFIAYSLDRSDWMTEFLQVMHEELEDISKKSKKPHLTLIKGGLLDHAEN